MDNNIFEDLFVLELSNNHWGDVERGKKIITDYSKIIKSNNVKAAIKLQFRDVDHIIHSDFRNRDDIRYIKKILATKMSYDDYEVLVEAIKKAGCITMSTPFDEKSVETCINLGIQIIKIASSDINDWKLIEKIATAKKPVIVSTGGSSVKNIDDIVKFFENLDIPLAINHCVSIYPSEKYELQLNQIDFLKNRYPNHVIGFSTHEYNDGIEIPMHIAYAKGARTFERHIDINWGGRTPTAYCSEPKDIDRWIKAYFKAKEICGAPSEYKTSYTTKEIEYLDSMVRGAYAKHDLKAGDALSDKDVYLAIPLQKGQISCRELINGKVLLKDVKKDKMIKIDDIDSNNAYDNNLKELIYNRGI